MAALGKIAELLFFAASEGKPVEKKHENSTQNLKTHQLSQLSEEKR